MVPLPSLEAKVLMMRKHLEDRAVANLPYDEVPNSSIVLSLKLNPFIDGCSDGRVQWG